MPISNGFIVFHPLSLARLMPTKKNPEMGSAREAAAFASGSPSSVAAAQAGHTQQWEMGWGCFGW